MLERPLDRTGRARERGIEAQGRGVWTPLPLVNGWATYADPVYQPDGIAPMYVVEGGWVTLSGLVAGHSASSGHLGQVSREDLAPAHRWPFAAMSGVGALRVDVWEDGSILLIATATPFGSWISLNGIRFRIG